MPPLLARLPWVWEFPWMGMGTVVNPHGPEGILWIFSNGCEIKRKRVKHAIIVVIAVCMSPKQSSL